MTRRLDIHKGGECPRCGGAVFSLDRLQKYAAKAADAEALMAESSASESNSQRAYALGAASGLAAIVAEGLSHYTLTCTGRRS